MALPAFTEATFDDADHSSRFTSQLNTSDFDYSRVSDGSFPQYTGYHYLIEEAWGAGSNVEVESGLSLTLPTSGSYGPVRVLSVSFAFAVAAYSSPNDGQLPIGPLWLDIGNAANTSVLDTGFLLSPDTATGDLMFTTGLSPATQSNAFNLESRKQQWLMARLSFVNIDLTGGLTASSLSGELYEDTVSGVPRLLARQSVAPALLGFSLHHVKRVNFGFANCRRNIETFRILYDELRIFRNFPLDTLLGTYTAAPLPRRSRGASRLSLNLSGGDPLPGSFPDNLRLEDGTGLLLFDYGASLAPHRIDLGAVETLTYLTLEDAGGSLLIETGDKLAKES